MINVRRLQELLTRTTTILSKGTNTRRYLKHLGYDRVLIDGFVDVDDWKDHVVDCQILSIGVALDNAALVAEEFEKVLGGFDPAVLKEGPSYKYFVDYVGSELNAFRLLALGSALGLWHVLTPKDINDVPESIYNEAAVMGMVLMSGYPKNVLHEVRQAVG